MQRIIFLSNHKGYNSGETYSVSNNEAHLFVQELGVAMLYRNYMEDKMFRGAQEDKMMRSENMPEEIVSRKAKVYKIK